MRTQDKRVFNLMVDWQLMGLCIEREASGEPYEGKVAVGTVILERRDHRNWDGKTIREVILKPWQFSWTMPEAGEAYYNRAVDIATDWVYWFNKMPVLQECCKISTGMILQEIPRDPDLAAAHCCQYLNPKVAAKTREEWLEKGMTTIKVIGNHEFFKEG